MTEVQQPLPDPQSSLPLEQTRQQEKETARIEAFSDGIFAVAITLLVLDIHIPRLPNGERLPRDSALGSALLQQWPAYLAFLTSFVTIGIIWINHHRLFNYIKSSNNTLLALNLLLLLLIVFVPFPTSLLAEYIEPDYHIAAIIYSANFFIMAICFNLLWRYASYNNRLLDKQARPEAIEAITRQYRFGPIYYLIALILALFYAPASIAWNLLLALFFALPGEVITRLRFSRKKKNAQKG